MRLGKLYCVYTLRVVGERYPFYVGKSYKNSTRFLDHATEAKSGKDSPKNRKIRQAWSQNKTIITQIVLLTEDEDEAYKMEHFLVTFYGRRDNKTGNLTNQTDGGKGTKGTVKKKKKIVSRKKLSSVGN